MQPRLNPYQAAPATMKAMMGLETHLQDCGLDPALMDLVRTRASQINGCAYCIHMHTRDARARGETEERLYLLDAWRESPLYTDRERAALAWTEAVTLHRRRRMPRMRSTRRCAQHFAEDELVKLTVLIAAINAWNRIAISFRSMHPTKPHRRRREAGPRRTHHDRRMHVAVDCAAALIAAAPAYRHRRPRRDAVPM